jgi:hypothetical protein
LAESLVDLSGAVDHSDMVKRVASKARVTPPSEWIVTTRVGEAHYFPCVRSFSDLTEGELPTRHVLDRATAEHPVVTTPVSSTSEDPRMS